MELQKLNRGKAQVKLPKLGWVKFRASRSLDGETIRSATLTREGNHWFVSFLIDDGHTTPEVHARPGTAVGVDRGPFSLNLAWLAGASDTGCKIPLK